MSANLIALILLGNLGFVSCMDRNIYETTRPAVTRQYNRYLSDKPFRNDFDHDYSEARKSLLKSGFNNPDPHLFGDSSLKKRGISKIRNHEFSNF
jgi:hypothetical protein